MALPHIELLDTFAVWRDYFNFVVDEFNTASALPSANTLVRRDANGSIAVTTLNFVGTGTETFENKIINAANNTLILSLNDLQDVAISSTPNNNQILRYNTTSGNWIVANETVYTEYTDNDVDVHLNKNSASTNQVLSWTGSDYAWITQTALYSNSDVDTHLNTSAASTNQILSWNGSDYDWITQTPLYSNSDVDTHLNKSTANNNQILSWTGSDYDWVNRYTDSSVDSHLNTGSAVANQILSWTGTGFDWIDKSTITASYENADVDTHLNTSTAATNQILSWTGSDYAWITQTSTYTDSSVDSHLNTSTASTSQVLSWNGLDYDWVGLPSSYTNTDVDTHLNISTASPSQVLSWNGSDYDWIAPTSSDTLNDVINRGSSTTTTAIIPFLYSDQNSFPNAGTYHGAIAHSHQDGAMFFAHSGMWIELANLSDVPAEYNNTSVDVHLNAGSATANQVLSWTGTDYDWVDSSALGGGSSTVSRTTTQTTTASIANDVSADATLTGFKSYHLLKITTSAAAWVTLYIDTASRTADANRNILTDPSPSGGVIAEAITTGSQTINFTPAVIGWNNDGTPSTNIYAKIVNKSGSTTTITVTLTLIQIES